MKEKSNDDLKNIIDTSGWERVDYELRKKNIEILIKKLDELQTIPAINEILERLNNIKLSHGNYKKIEEKVKKIEEKVGHYLKEKEKFLSYYQIYDTKIKREKYKYDTTEDCLKIIRSASIEIVDNKHFGLSLTHHKASNWSEMADMINDNLGWDVDTECGFTEEQHYKWEQIRWNLPKALKNLIG